MTTATYITEFGMPYCGDKIEMLQLCRFSLNNHGIVGILAPEIQFLIEKNGDEQFLLNYETHPLRQSALLALARLENYFNP